MMALAASIDGAGGTRVNPAPRRAERSRWEPELTRLVAVVPPLPARCEPIAAEPSRLEPRVMVDTGLVSSSPPRRPDRPEPADGVAGVASPGVPHTSQ